MIEEGYRHNFETLQQACHNGDLGLMECTDAKTGQRVIVICAVHMDHDKYVFTPLAKMFDGNPYEELNPPE